MPRTWSPTTPARPRAARPRAPNLRAVGRQGPPSAAVLGLSARSVGELQAAVTAGLPYAAFMRLQERLALPAAELAEASGVNVRTLARRKHAGRLDPNESDRIVRLARLYGLAHRLLESDDTTRRWLTSPKRALAGATPLAYAATEVGAREVEALLGRLAHGVVA